ncbi:Ig-like domain-containing protein [Clostridium sp. CF012]|uniref:Ig-like domain-containing protein n=1 Tax=Clostridium sp. CF012 TaxID=2843319 RepID=UPI001C0D0E43|nr:Ig-like domain-containing protein [Clostridium sp. CF012]MBU3144902.1 Ig-like domain-containing protein [Clostridium sp. CF012]
MRKRNGFTLVEVILAIAILGIISVSFLTILSSHFIFLNKTKVISQEVFLTQRDMEMEIDNVKEKIRNKELILKEKVIFNSLGGIKVNYYEVEKTHNNKAYYTLVSNVKPEVLTPIALKNIGIKVKQGSNNVSYGYVTGGFSIVGNFENDAAYKWDHLLNVVEWYVSTKEYTTPLPKDPRFSLNDDIINDSYYYPLFPRDYELVSNETINNFGSYERTFPLSLEEYKGRHIIFTATPGAKSGKIGKQSVSSPVFISGLPITQNAVSHFDAGFIDPSAPTEVDVNKVRKWLDISSIYGQSIPNESASKIDKTPELMKMGMGTGFKWQYVSFSANDQYLEIPSQNTNNNDIYIFAVVRNKIGNEESVFLKNGEHEFSIPKEETTGGQKWFLVKEAISSKNDKFRIGGPNVDIAEVVIYKGRLTSEKIDTIEKYFNEKYKSPILIGDISELKSMQSNIKLGASFNLPSFVLAEMSRGYEKPVAVSWTGTVNLNTLGQYKLEGTSLTNPNKKMTYTLNVVDNK